MRQVENCRPALVPPSRQLLWRSTDAKWCRCVVGLSPAMRLRVCLMRSACTRLSSRSPRRPSAVTSTAAKTRSGPLPARCGAGPQVPDAPSSNASLRKRCLCACIAGSPPPSAASLARRICRGAAVTRPAHGRADIRRLGLCRRVGDQGQGKYSLCVGIGES